MFTAYLLERADSPHAADATARLETRIPSVFTEEDVASVRAKTESSWLITSGRHTRSEVILRFKATAAARIRERLVYEVGEYLALIVDGKVIAQQMVVAPPTGEEFSIAGTFTPDEAKALAKKIKTALR